MRNTTLMSATRKPGRVLAVLGATVLFGGLAAGCGSSGGDADASSETSASGEVVEETVVEGSNGDKNRKLLEGAMGGKDSVVCEFTEAGVEGKMFIQGESNFRFEGQSQDGPIRMVRDGDQLYMWEPSGSTGLSINVASQNPGEEIINPMDLEDEGMVDNLKCEKYTGDMALLRAPGDVEFSSLEDLMGGAMDAEQLEGLLNGAGGAGSEN